MFARIVATSLLIMCLVVCGFEAAGQDEKPKTGTIIGELKSWKDTPDGKNTFIEVLAPGEEKARRYHVLYDAKEKAPVKSVLAAVRAAKIGDRVEFDWVQTGHGPAMKTALAGKPNGRAAFNLHSKSEEWQSKGEKNRERADGQAARSACP